ncbi:carbohydrate esterase family 5 protein [Mollisia scopiformis]|uniref:cutinase n=1 Tax=Mollisia scopiformis TaxID=149040 RepID=A0A132BDG5_MOLSC|nr:carbohydrate esterase family 5 protein [Mollisia scopiformis]KUJ10472.1 carbohydrate esterase family 5 protein [Mollisia scopiformis]
MKTSSTTSVALLALLSLTIASPLQRRASDTANDLTNGSGCKAMTVVFARGTTETGNVGTLAGPPFFSALQQQVGASNVAVQGVDYPADIPGFLAGGDKAGSALMAKMVGMAMTTCPDTKVVMAGYSQGGQLVHNAAKMLSASQSAAVSSAVIFGDPDNGAAVGSVPAAKTKVICHTGDNICQNGDAILAPHLTYSTNAGEAASFVAGAAGM